MKRFILSVTMVLSLAAAAGCGAHSARHSATPAASNVADLSSDPSWCPPGEEFSVGDARGVAPSKHEERNLEMKPNAAQRPTQGAVHAAVY
jgi:hypothetical protein